MDGFLKPENSLEALYAFMPAKDSVTLNSELPPITKYKKKGRYYLTQDSFCSESARNHCKKRPSRTISYT